MTDRLDRGLVRLMAVLLVGAWAALLDTTIVSVAIGDITRAFDTTLRMGQWATSAYLLAMAAVIPLMGWLTDRFGMKRVDPAWLRTRVVTTTGDKGGYAELAAARADDHHRIPDGLDPQGAAAVVADGRTALGLHEAAAPEPGEVVVVTAAAGGVGSLLVQLTKATGARVVALAGGPEKLSVARSLGADATVDYRRAGWVEGVRAAAPDGVDVVFDGVGGETTPALFGLVRPGSRHVRHGAVGGAWTGIAPEEAAAREVTLIPVSAIAAGPGDMHRIVEEALAMAAGGRLRPVIGQTYPLEEAAAAHAAIEARKTIGKTLLMP
jgi:NADPH2:quinone reductase